MKPRTTSLDFAAALGLVLTHSMQPQQYTPSVRGDSPRQRDTWHALAQRRKNRKAQRQARKKG